MEDIKIHFYNDTPKSNSKPKRGSAWLQYIIPALIAGCAAFLGAWISLSGVEKEIKGVINSDLQEYAFNIVSDDNLNKDEKQLLLNLLVVIRDIALDDVAPDEFRDEIGKLFRNSFRLVGTVINSVDGGPIEGVRVVIDRVDDPSAYASTFTDEYGNFELEKIFPQQEVADTLAFTLNVYKPGFIPTPKTFQNLRKNTELTTKEILLIPK